MRTRARRKSLALVVATTTGALITGVAAAPQADAAINLTLGPGSYTADTTHLTLTGGSVSLTGVNQGGIAVFKFGNLTVQSGATIVATGSRPLELLASGSLTVGGLIESNGADAVRGDLSSGTGGAGGGGGGIRPGTLKGGGPGGGSAGTVDSENGGGGGGFGGKGARGGTCNSGDCPGETGVGGAAGPAYGDLNVKLQGGSGGGPGASDARGGGGGGAIGLFGNSVNIQSGAAVVADGGSGDTGSGGASGGGSGGGVIVHGNSVTLNGVLIANGGAGGAGGCCGDGGGGAGGRVAVQYKSFVSNFEIIVEAVGGASGTHSSGPYGHGGLSPDTNGANGSITFTQIDASHLTIGGNRTISKGTSVTIATKLTDAGTGNAIGGQSVSLWRKPASGGSWTKVTSKTTSSSGTASVSVTPTASTIYQWRFGGTFVHLATNSPTETVTVH